MYIYRINYRREIHICNFKNFIVIEADIKHK